MGEGQLTSGNSGGKTQVPEGKDSPKGRRNPWEGLILFFSSGSIAIKRLWAVGLFSLGSLAVLDGPLVISLELRQPPTTRNLVLKSKDG